MKLTVELGCPNKNVIPFTGQTRLDVPADRVLANTPSDMQSIIVLGYDADGDEFFASSMADGGDVLWLLERFKMHLLKAVEE